MHTNIVHFPATANIDRKPISPAMTANVINLADWQNAARIRRTRHGVFFVSNLSSQISCAA